MVFSISRLAARMISKARLERPIPELRSHLAHSFSTAEKKIGRPVSGLSPHSRLRQTRQVAPAVTSWDRQKSAATGCRYGSGERPRLVLGTGFCLNHFADGPLAGLHFRAAFIFLGLFGLAVTMLFAVCHCRALQRFRRRDTVSYRSKSIQ
jgi:hypothetical protein